MLVIFKDEEVNEESVGRLDESGDAGDKKGQGMSSRTGAGGGGIRESEDRSLLSANLSHASYREAWWRDYMCKRRNDSKAFQWPHFLQYLSSCPFACFTIRYFYQSAVGSRNTEAQLLHPNLVQSNGGRERVRTIVDRNARGEADERGPQQNWHL